MDEMDVTQALADTENALRDFISVVLHKKLGELWLDGSGVSPERLRKWNERKAEEEKRQQSGAIEQRLIYYADFYDLSTILKKHWDGEFSAALGEWKRMEVWLNELEKLRDPDAHRRELMPHQKHLITGVSGEIRTLLARYRSKQETSEDYYPRLEAVRDNLGNFYSYGASNLIKTKTRLQVGGQLDIVVTASDPQGKPLEYAISVNFSPSSFKLKWQDSNVFHVRIGREHVARVFCLSIMIRGQQEFHASASFDDNVDFLYEVLPPL